MAFAPRDRPVVDGPLEAHADEAAIRAPLRHAGSDVHAPLQVRPVLHAADVRLHASHAFRQVLVATSRRPEVRDGRRGPVVLQPCLVRLEAPPAFGPVRKDRLQRVGQMFRDVEKSRMRVTARSEKNSSQTFRIQLAPSEITTSSFAANRPFRCASRCGRFPNPVGPPSRAGDIGGLELADCSGLRTLRRRSNPKRIACFPPKYPVTQQFGRVRTGRSSTPHQGGGDEGQCPAD